MDTDTRESRPSTHTLLSSPTDRSQDSTSRSDAETIFNNIYTYPWSQDGEFQSGLSSILGNLERLVSRDMTYEEADILLQAKCFYFARQDKTPNLAREKDRKRRDKLTADRKQNITTPIDVAAYKSWLRTQEEEQTQDHTQSIISTSATAQPQPNHHDLPPPPPSRNSQSQDTLPLINLHRATASSPPPPRKMPFHPLPHLLFPNHRPNNPQPAHPRHRRDSQHRPRRQPIATRYDATAAEALGGRDGW